MTEDGSVDVGSGDVAPEVSAPALQGAEERVGWLLSLEPLGTDDLAWSLCRADDDDPGRALAGGLAKPAAALRQLVAEMIPSIAAPRPGPPSSLWTGPLTDPLAERALSVRLGEGLLPPALRAALLVADPQRTRSTVTIATRGWLASVPWEILALDPRGDVRLVERARVCAGLSPTVSERRRLAPRATPGAPPLRVIDPGPRAVTGLRPIYPGGYPAAWQHAVPFTESAGLLPDGEPYGVDAFGADLRREPGWSRLLYFGHALAGTAEVPSRAALVFSARNGIDELSAHAWLATPERWPVPPRIALIACGSDDAMHLEQSGLAVAAVNAGAEFVTVTRWSLPTDADPPTDAATTDLVLAVDQAHDRPEALNALRELMIDRLNLWRRTGRISDSPILWGSLTSYVVPSSDGDDR